jgi:hypothetical protein
LQPETFLLLGWLPTATFFPQKTASMVVSASISLTSAAAIEAATSVFLAEIVSG